MRDKYKKRTTELLTGNVAKTEVIERPNFDIIKLTYDDGTTVQINSTGSLKSNLEVTERD